MTNNFVFMGSANFATNNGGGGSGTYDYNQLENKPTLNDRVLENNTDLNEVLEAHELDMFNTDISGWGLPGMSSNDTTDWGDNNYVNLTATSEVPGNEVFHICNDDGIPYSAGDVTFPVDITVELREHIEAYPTGGLVINDIGLRIAPSEQGPKVIVIQGSHTGEEGTFEDIFSTPDIPNEQGEHWFNRNVQDFYQEPRYNFIRFHITEGYAANQLVLPRLMINSQYMLNNRYKTVIKFPHDISIQRNENGEYYANTYPRDELDKKFNEKQNNLRTDYPINKTYTENRPWGISRTDGQGAFLNEVAYNAGPAPSAVPFAVGMIGTALTLTLYKVQEFRENELPRWATEGIACALSQDIYNESIILADYYADDQSTKKILLGWLDYGNVFEPRILISYDFAGNNYTVYYISHAESITTTDTTAIINYTTEGEHYQQIYTTTLDDAPLFKHFMITVDDNNNQNTEIVPLDENGERLHQYAANFNRPWGEIGGINAVMFDIQSTDTEATAKIFNRYGVGFAKHNTDNLTARVVDNQSIESLELQIDWESGLGTNERGLTFFRPVGNTALVTLSSEEFANIPDDQKQGALFVVTGPDEGQVSLYLGSTPIM